MTGTPHYTFTRFWKCALQVDDAENLAVFGLVAGSIHAAQGQVRVRLLHN